MTINYVQIIWKYMMVYLHILLLTKIYFTLTEEIRTILLNSLSRYPIRYDLATRRINALEGLSPYFSQNTLLPEQEWPALPQSVVMSVIRYHIYPWYITSNQTRCLSVAILRYVVCILNTKHPVGFGSGPDWQQSITAATRLLNSDLTHGYEHGRRSRGQDIDA